uniref:Uncharacterized protein n=1 Tax=Romanomermis culicivorax TaxID=13658 RepID=A0A915KC62_ROMCU
MLAARADLYASRMVPVAVVQCIFKRILALRCTDFENSQNQVATVKDVLSHFGVRLNLASSVEGEDVRLAPIPNLAFNALQNQVCERVSKYPNVHFAQNHYYYCFSASSATTND